MSRSRTPLRLALAVATTVAGAVALAPAGAHAATLGPATYDGHDYIRYAAEPGESNRLHVRSGPSNTVVFEDTGASGIKAYGAVCSEVSPTEARCAAAAVPGLALLLGDLDDRVTVDVAEPALADGGAGNDVLTGSNADEALLGGEGDDVLDGRGGADYLRGYGGVDTVRYASRTASVTVDLASVANGEEGQAGERDSVHSDVERVIGGAGNDRLTGNAAANLLVGGAGDDALTGGLGADDLRGGAGRDTVRARDGVVDQLDCGDDGDRVDADAVDRVAACETLAPAPGPAPAPTSAPGLSVPFSFIFGEVELPDRPVSLERGRVKLEVSCPVGTPSGRCFGVISLVRIAAKPKAPRAGASRRTRRFRKVGEKTYALRAGRRARVSVRMSSAARRTIARRGSIRVKVLLRRTKRAKHATKIGTLKVQASRRTKRRRPS